jgi:DNA polymerase-3 subunit beta
MATTRLTGEVFARAIGRVAGVTFKDPARPELAGVLLESMGPGLRLVATDNYRLAVVELGGVEVLDPVGRLLVDAEDLRSLATMLRAAEGEPVEFEPDYGRLWVCCGYRSVTVKLLDADRFPAYERVVPVSWDALAMVDRAPLMAAVKELQAAYGRQETVRVELTADGVVLSGPGDFGPEFVGCQVEGDPVVVFLGLDFLRAGLQAAGGRLVTLSVTGDRQPVAVRSVSDPGFLYVIAQRRPFGGV